MLTLVKEQKSGIVAGIIASAAFMYFIDPILNLLSFFFIAGSRVLGSAYIDRLYAQVALLDTLNYGFVFYALLLLLFLGIAFGTVTVVVKSWLKAKKTAEPDIELERDEQTAVKNDEKVDSEGNSRKRAFPFAMLTLLLFCTCAISSIIVSNFIQNSLVTSFKQHIRIVAPYITEQDEKLLISEWSQMNSEAGYVAVYKKLEDIAKENQLTLPSNKIYSMTAI